MRSVDLLTLEPGTLLELAGGYYLRCFQYPPASFTLDDSGVRVLTERYKVNRVPEPTLVVLLDAKLVTRELSVWLQHPEFGTTQLLTSRFSDPHMNLFSIPQGNGKPNVKVFVPWSNVALS